MPWPKSLDAGKPVECLVLNVFHRATAGIQKSEFVGILYVKCDIFTIKYVGIEGKAVAFHNFVEQFFVMTFCFNSPVGSFVVRSITLQLCHAYQYQFIFSIMGHTSNKLSKKSKVFLGKIDPIGKI